jgi:hypothetical protein
MTSERKDGGAKLPTEMFGIPTAFACAEFNRKGRHGKSSDERKMASMKQDKIARLSRTRSTALLALHPHRNPTADTLIS